MGRRPIIGEFTGIRKSIEWRGGTSGTGDKGNVRTVKHQLESRIGRRIEGDHNLIPWLIKHARQLVNRHKVREDGKTSHCRVRGKAFKRVTMEFGECVWYLKPGS